VIYISLSGYDRLAEEVAAAEIKYGVRVVTEVQGARRHSVVPAQRRGAEKQKIPARRRPHDERRRGLEESELAAEYHRRRGHRRNPQPHTDYGQRQSDRDGRGDYIIHGLYPNLST
jgi:hypothetical protein